MNGYIIESADGKFFAGETRRIHWAHYLQASNIYSSRRGAQSVAAIVGGTVKRHGDVREFDLNSHLYDHR